MKTPESVIALIARARPLHIPAGRAGIRAFARQADYRGKRQWIVGYSWHKLYAHHLSGRVYECVLGYGPTLEAAMAKAEARVNA